MFKRLSDFFGPRSGRPNAEQAAANSTAVNLALNNKTRAGQGDASLSPEDSIHLLRTQIASILLVSSAVMGGIILLFNFPNLLNTGSWVTIMVSTALIATAFGISRLPAVPHNIRAAVLVLGIYLLAVFTLVSGGLGDNGRILLLAVPIFAAFVFPPRLSYWSLALSLLTLIGVELLSSTGMLSSRAPFLENMDRPVAGLLLDSVGFLLVSLLLTFAIQAMLQKYSQTLTNKAALVAELNHQSIELKTEVWQRTKEIERRLSQIRSAAEISRSLGAVLDTRQLLNLVVERIRTDFDLYYVGVFLLDTEAEKLGVTPPGVGPPTTGIVPTVSAPGAGFTTYALLVAGTGDAGREMLARGHKLAVGSGSMIGTSLAARQARIALDVSGAGSTAEFVRFNNPFLPETRSEMALPILVRRQSTSETNEPEELIPLGALTIQSSHAAAFDEGDIAVLQGIADSLGIALENARLFTELRLSLGEIQSLHRQYLAASWSEVRQAAGDAYTYTYQPSTPGTSSHVLQIPIALRDENIGNLTLELSGGQSTLGAVTLNDEERALVEGVIAQAALALENARLIAETEQRVLLEKLRADLSSRIWASPDMETVLRTALQELAIALGASEGHIELQVGSLSGGQAEIPQKQGVP